MRKISVIIPALNEEKMLDSLLQQLCSSPAYAEIIVVDGGSKDGTRDIINNYPKVNLITSDKGRAIQMNKGAKFASGEILWFLHADSTVVAQAGELIDGELDGRSVAGSFYLKFNKNNFWLNLYSWISRANCTIFTYGDQGIFLYKHVFDALGGFKDIPIMEDLDLVRRLKRTGYFSKLSYPVVTSARRFERNGMVRQEIKNLFLVMGYYVGLSPNFLARFYKY